MSKFAEKLKELRMELNLKMENLGKVVGVSKNTISRWERGERLPNLENIEALAKYFNVSSEYLCGLED